MAFRRTFVLLIVVPALLVAGAGSARAALEAAAATLSRMTGQVEVLRKGETAWVMGAPGGHLGDGDQLRARSAGSAEIALPDGSLVTVAENTRVALTRVALDAATGQRAIAVHVAAGKIRAQVVRLTGDAAQRSIFTISSPEGVAAVKGTIAVFAYNPETRQGLLFVLPSPGQPASTAQVTYFNFATRTSMTVAGNQFISQEANQLPSRPAPIASLPPTVQQQIQTVTNAATASSAALVAPTVTIVTPQQLQQALTTINVQTQAVAAPPSAPPPALVPPPPLAPAPPVGRDTEVTQATTAATTTSPSSRSDSSSSSNDSSGGTQQQNCATPPC
jgi:hypothetical protein